MLPVKSACLRQVLLTFPKISIYAYMGRTRKNRVCPFVTIKNLISVFRVYTKLETVSFDVSLFIVCSYSLLRMAFKNKSIKQNSSSFLLVISSTAFLFKPCVTLFLNVLAECGSLPKILVNVSYSML